MVARKTMIEERRKKDKDELQSIADGTWQPPFKIIGLANAVVLYNNNFDP